MTKVATTKMGCDDCANGWVEFVEITEHKEGTTRVIATRSVMRYLSLDMLGHEKLWHCGEGETAALVVKPCEKCQPSWRPFEKRREEEETLADRAERVAREHHAIKIEHDDDLLPNRQPQERPSLPYKERDDE